MTDIFDRNATKGVKTDTVLTETKDIEFVRKQQLLYFSPLALLTLAACGGGGSSSSTGTTSGNSQAISYSGSVVKGPLQNAFVFLDENGDGKFNSSEPSARTDASGNFTLSSSLSSVPFVAQTDNTTIDTSSGEVLADVVLKAPAGATVVTPMTTIMSEAGISAADVSKVLGLPSNVDPLKFNPYAADADEAAALAVEKVAQQVMTTIKAVSSAAEGAGSSADEAFDIALASVAEIVKENATAPTKSTINFSDSAELTKITDKASTKLAEKRPDAKEKFDAIKEDVNAAVINVNTQIAAVESLNSDETRAAFAVGNELQSQVKSAAQLGEAAAIVFKDAASVVAARSEKVQEIVERKEAGEIPADPTDNEAPVPEAPTTPVTPPSVGGGGGAGGGTSAPSPVPTKTTVSLDSLAATVTGGGSELAWRDEISITLKFDTTDTIFSDTSVITVTLADGWEVLLEKVDGKNWFTGKEVTPINVSSSALKVQSVDLSALTLDATSTHEVDTSLAAKIKAVALGVSVDAVLPTPTVSRISYDSANQDIIIEGSGFSDVAELDLSKLTLDIDDVGGSDSLNIVGSLDANHTDTQMVVSLSSALSDTNLGTTGTGTRDNFVVAAGLFKDAYGNASVGTSTHKWKIPTIDAANFKTSSNTLTLTGEDLDALSTLTFDWTKFSWFVDGSDDSEYTLLASEVTPTLTGARAIDVVISGSSLLNDINLGGTGDKVDKFSTEAGFLSGLSNTVSKGDITNDTAGPTITKYELKNVVENLISPGRPGEITATASEDVKAGSTITVNMSTAPAGQTAPYAVELTALEDGVELTGTYTPTGSASTSSDVSIAAASIDFNAGGSKIRLQDLFGNQTTNNSSLLPDSVTNITPGVRVDVTAPNTQITKVKYDPKLAASVSDDVQAIITLESGNSTTFSQIFGSTADPVLNTDISQYFDWTKFKWLIDNKAANKVTLNDKGNVDLTAVDTDVVHEVVLTSATNLEIRLKDDSPLEGKSNFANFGERDGIVIENGFVRDKAGNPGTEDGLTTTTITWVNQTSPQITSFEAVGTPSVSPGTFKLGDNLKVKAITDKAITSDSTIQVTFADITTPVTFTATGSKELSYDFQNTSGILGIAANSDTDGLAISSHTPGTNTLSGQYTSNGLVTNTDVYAPVYLTGATDAIVIDATAPAVQPTAVSYDLTTKTIKLTIDGTNSLTGITTNKDANLKSYLDWDKFEWIRDPNAADKDSFKFIEANIDSAKATKSTTLEIKLKSSGADSVVNSFEGTNLGNFGSNTSDDENNRDQVKISEGFFKDLAGNVSDYDGDGVEDQFTFSQEVSFTNSGSAITKPSISAIILEKNLGSGWVSVAENEVLKAGTDIRFKATTDVDLAPNSKFLADMTTRSDAANDTVIFERDATDAKVLYATKFIAGEGSTNTPTPTALKVSSFDSTSAVGLDNFRLANAGDYTLAGRYNAVDSGLNEAPSNTDYSDLGITFDPSLPNITVSDVRFNVADGKIILTSSNDTPFVGAVTHGGIVATASATTDIAGQLGNSGSLTWETGSTPEPEAILNSDISVAYVTATNKLEITLKDKTKITELSGYGVNVDTRAEDNTVTLAAGFFEDANGNVSSEGSNAVTVAYSDATGPKALQITTSLASGTYQSGSVVPDNTADGKAFDMKIPITLTFDEALHPTSSVTLDLNGSRTVTLDKVSGNSISGDYVVQASDSVAELQADTITVNSAYDIFGNQSTSTGVSALKSLQADAKIALLAPASVLDQGSIGEFDAGDKLVFQFAGPVKSSYKTALENSLSTYVGDATQDYLTDVTWNETGLILTLSTGVPSGISDLQINLLDVEFDGYDQTPDILFEFSLA